MRLLLLRHAKSSWADEGLDDWQRPLNDRGERDAPRVGTLLRELKLAPDLIVSSDAVRAEATARAAAEAAGYTGRIVVSPELYHSSPATIVDVLHSLDGTANSVLIVAHNPGLEDLVKRLTGQSVELPTATLVHIELSASRWSEVTLSPDATLVEVWRPREL